MTESESQENLVRVQLFGGEQDGYFEDVKVRPKVPPMFWIWPAKKHRDVFDRSGNKRPMLARKLATLAYEFVGEVQKHDVPGQRELQYRRCETADKKQSDTVV